MLAFFPCYTLAAMKVHLLTIIGCIVALVPMAGVLMVNSAPQEGALAAIAVACAVIPYCFARAVDLLRAFPEKELHKLNETLAVHTRLLAAMANAAASQTCSTAVAPVASPIP